DMAKPPGLPPDEDVLRDRKVRKQGRMLVNDGNPQALGRYRSQDRRLDAILHDAAGVRLMNAAENLDERALAGAVLTREAMHLAGAKGEIDVLEDLHRTEALADPTSLDHRCHEIVQSCGSKWLRCAGRWPAPSARQRLTICGVRRGRAWKRSPARHSRLEVVVFVVLGGELNRLAGD